MNYTKPRVSHNPSAQSFHTEPKPSRWTKLKSAPWIPLTSNNLSAAVTMEQSDGPSEEELIQDIRARVLANAGWGPYSTGCPHIPSSVVYGVMMKAQDTTWDLSEEEKMAKMLQVVEIAGEKSSDEEKVHGSRNG